MIYGRMSEAVNEVAALEDVEIGTFVHFIQWAYTGSYKIKSNDNNSNNNNNKKNEVGANHNELREFPTDEDEGPEKASASGSRRIRPMRSRNFRDPTWRFEERDYFSISPLENLRKAFHERDYPVTESPLLLAELSSSSSSSHTKNNSNANNRELSQDQQPDLFLPHAKIFVFADKYDIQPLKMRAIHNLHQALSHYQLIPQNVSHITNSIQYSYENTHAPDDLLRELFASYVELEMAVLIEAKPFEDLLEAGGDFVGDFLKRVKKRIS